SLARGSDPSIRIRACEALAKMDAADRTAAGAKDDGSPELTAYQILELVPTPAAVLFLADSCYHLYGKIWGMPFKKEFAPILKAEFPQAWVKYRAAAAKVPEWLADFDALGNGPVVTVAQILEQYSSLRRPKPTEPTQGALR